MIVLTSCVLIRHVFPLISYYFQMRNFFIQGCYFYQILLGSKDWVDQNLNYK